MRFARLLRQLALARRMSRCVLAHLAALRLEHGAITMHHDASYAAARGSVPAFTPAERARYDAGALLWLLREQLRHAHALRIVHGGAGCAWGAALECRGRKSTFVATVLLAATSLVYVAAYFSYLLVLALQLRRQRYQDFRLAHQLLQIEARASRTVFCGAGDVMHCACLECSACVLRHTRDWAPTETCWWCSL